MDLWLQEEGKTLKRQLSQADNGQITTQQNGRSTGHSECGHDGALLYFRWSETQRLLQISSR